MGDGHVQPPLADHGGGPSCDGLRSEVVAVETRAAHTEEEAAGGGVLCAKDERADCERRLAHHLGDVGAGEERCQIHVAGFYQKASPPLPRRAAGCGDVGAGTAPSPATILTGRQGAIFKYCRTNWAIFLAAGAATTPPKIADVGSSTTTMTSSFGCLAGTSPINDATYSPAAYPP